MRVYKHRKDPEYIKLLEERLAIDGPNGLRARSISIATPRMHDGKSYDRCCRIDFAGIAATTLLDDGGIYTNGHVAARMRDLFARAGELNSEGIFVKLRFLLVYPYSAYAFARIQAEATRNRSSIEEPVYPRNLDIVESVDKRTFEHSPFVISQVHTLDQLQEWVDEQGWDRKTLNRVSVRFVPASPNFCLLFINDTVFIDPYLLAKQRRARNECALLGPLVRIERSRDSKTFAAIDDHFRYLWDLDLSVYCQDGTSYEPGQPRSLGDIKPPTTITFARKANIIKEKSPDLSDESLDRWKSRSRRLLNRFCLEPAPSPGSDTLFITCAWRSEAGQSTPNEYAMELSNFLDEDFGRKRKEPVLSVFIMEGRAGEFFTQQLYARLDESTLGLVLLTADIEGQDGSFYSRPNVYHELGYLMKQLGGKRVAILSEDGVTVPTNISDVIRIDFPRDKLVLAYAKIAGWVIRASSLGAKAKDVIEENIVKRLDEAVDSKAITAEEAVKAKKSIANYLVPPN